MGEGGGPEPLLRIRHLEQILKTVGVGVLEKTATAQQHLLVLEDHVP